MNAVDVIAYISQHALDMVTPPLSEGQSQRAIARRLAGYSSHRAAPHRDQALLEAASSDAARAESLRKENSPQPVPG